VGSDADYPRRPRHPDLDALDVVIFNAGREGGARDPDRSDGREVHSRHSGATIHSEPDLAGVLGSEAVEPKSGEQAEHASYCQRGDIERVTRGMYRLTRYPISPLGQKCGTCWTRHSQ